MDETIDSLGSDGLVIIQPSKGYRFGMDSVLLSDFASPAKNERILDLGCGDGILLFLLWQKEPTCFGTGLELRADACERARRSAELNGLGAVFEVLRGDLRRIREYPLSVGYSLCVCNPPYWQKDTFEDDGARTLSNCTYGEIASAAAFALRPKGRFCVICPAENFDLMIAECVRNGFALRRIRFVHSRPGAPGKRALLEFGRRIKHGGTKVLPPIYTSELSGNGETERTDRSDGERKL